MKTYRLSRWRRRTAHWSRPRSLRSRLRLRLAPAPPRPLRGQAAWGRLNSRPVGRTPLCGAEEKERKRKKIMSSILIRNVKLPVKKILLGIIKSYVRLPISIIVKSQLDIRSFDNSELNLPKDFINSYAFIGNLKEA